MMISPQKLVYCRWAEMLRYTDNISDTSGNVGLWKVKLMGSGKRQTLRALFLIESVKYNIHRHQCLWSSPAVFPQSQFIQPFKFLTHRRTSFTYKPLIGLRACQSGSETHHLQGEDERKTHARQKQDVGGECILGKAAAGQLSLINTGSLFSPPCTTFRVGGLGGRKGWTIFLNEGEHLIIHSQK